MLLYAHPHQRKIETGGTSITTQSSPTIVGQVSRSKFILWSLVSPYRSGILPENGDTNNTQIALYSNIRQVQLQCRLTVRRQHGKFV